MVARDRRSSHLSVALLDPDVNAISGPSRASESGTSAFAADMVPVYGHQMLRFGMIAAAAIALAACTSTTGPQDADLPDSGCPCAAGQVCVHDYYVHDPPPAGPDGSPCAYGVPRYGRCWTITDRCVARPTACDANSSCACPGAAICNPLSSFNLRCEVEGASSVDCYSIGI